MEIWGSVEIPAIVKNLRYSAIGACFYAWCCSRFHVEDPIQLFAHCFAPVSESQLPKFKPSENPFFLWLQSFRVFYDVFDLESAYLVSSRLAV